MVSCVLHVWQWWCKYLLHLLFAKDFCHILVLLKVCHLFSNCSSVHNIFHSSRIVIPFPRFVFIFCHIHKKKKFFNLIRFCCIANAGLNGIQNLTAAPILRTDHRIPRPMQHQNNKKADWPHSQRSIFLFSNQHAFNLVNIWATINIKQTPNNFYAFVCEPIKLS